MNATTNRTTTDVSYTVDILGTIWMPQVQAASGCSITLKEILEQGGITTDVLLSLSDEEQYEIVKSYVFTHKAGDFSHVDALRVIRYVTVTDRVSDNETRIVKTVTTIREFEDDEFSAYLDCTSDGWED